MDNSTALQWVGVVSGILGVAVGTPGIILALLNRKNANRALVVQEVGAEVEQMSGINEGYKGLWEMEKAIRVEAVAELKTYKEEREGILAEVAELRDHSRRRDLLFMEIVRQNRIVLTKEQQEEFDATRPKPSYRKRPATAQ